MKKAIALFFLCILISSASFADRRNYVWTYQYMTMPKNATEMELYQTTKLADTDDWEYRLEIEHGLTVYWDFSVYQIFSQQQDSSFRWDAVQFRTRYRLFEEGEFFVDPLLYFEYNRKIDLNKSNKFEAKLIMAKTIGLYNLAINPVYELFAAPGIEHEFGLDAGFSYQFKPKFIAGFESTTRIEFEDDETEVGSYFGPTVSFASGNWWYAIGSAWGITDDSDRVRIRFLMGIHL